MVTTAEVFSSFFTLYYRAFPFSLCSPTPGRESVGSQEVACQSHGSSGPFSVHKIQTKYKQAI